MEDINKVVACRVFIAKNQKSYHQSLISIRPGDNFSRFQLPSLFTILILLVNVSTFNSTSTSNNFINHDTTAPVYIRRTMMLYDGIMSLARHWSVNSKT